MQTRLPEYTQRDSLWHRMDARWKLAAVFLCMVSVVLLRDLAALAVTLAAALGLLAASRLPWSWYLARLGGIALFLSLFLILLPLTMPGDDWHIGPVALSAAGFETALMICLKALTIVALALFLFASAPFETTLKAAHALHVPGLLVQLLMLTYRYIFLLGDELGKLRIALRLRGYRNRVSMHSYRTIAHVTGTLLVRSYERAERVSQAMRCRAFDGQFRSLDEFHTQPGDPAKAGLLVGLFAALPWGLALLDK